MSQQGYYRYPTLFQDRIAFVSDDDVWEVPVTGGKATRLTTSRGLATTPVFSPDGSHIAFAGSEEGALEVYTLELSTGILKRLTYLGDTVMVCAWTQEGIYFSAPSGQCLRVSTLWRISAEGGVATDLMWGPAQNISFNSEGQGVVIQRHGYREYGFWKRYRGGTAGELWIDPKGEGQFHTLLTLKGNFAKPLWVQNRIYFVGDHEGVGNLYSCTPAGTDIQRHTHHTDFYVRNQSTDGHQIVYQAGGDLYIYDPKNQLLKKVDIDFSSMRMQRQRKWIHGSEALYDYDLHPKGHHLLSTHRGKLRVYNAYEGPVLPLGECDEDTLEKRYRHCVWLKDGKRALATYTQDNEDVLELFNAETGDSVSKSPLLDLGRIIHLKMNPQHDVVALVNHRSQLLIVDLDSWQVRVVDRSPYADIGSMDWSPDGLWLAYECTLDRRRMGIKMTGLEDTTLYQITDPVLKDFSPTFDPEGKYLYFISSREFFPTHDSLHFELGFPAGMRPYMVTLRADVLNPFSAQYSLNEESSEEDTEEEAGDNTKGEDTKSDAKKSEKIEPITIDFKDITDRIIALPIEPGQFSHAVALKGKLIYLSHPLVEGDESDDSHEEEGVILEAFDLETKKTEEFIDFLHSFTVSLDRKFLIYEGRKKLRILKTLEKPDDSIDVGSKKSGWVDLSRVRLKIDPLKEWRQIYNEAWRLQRDHFWVQDMSGVDWDLVYKRYQPLVERVSSRRELSDVLWEMQGELGTSHAYVVGGDWKVAPKWGVGFLGAKFQYSTKNNGYQIEEIIKGDLWDAKIGSPLAKAGVSLQKGDTILAIDGQKVSPIAPLESQLVAKAKQDVMVTFKKASEAEKRTVSVRTLSSQHPGEYRDWVNGNRKWTHEKSQGQVGYIHIPDMSSEGYAEFHRGFLAECDRPGLIVDVRFNGGGSVSQLLLEKLARRRMGYDLSRWHDLIPYPADSGHGRMVALTNEYAGSDGDMFSSMFKAMKLGPLIGKRTWGGVIGIWPKHHLIDAGYTTQPEYSFWSYAEGWAMENYGVDPDITVDIAPQDYAAGCDPQLERALTEVLKILEASPVVEPDLSIRPRLTIPKCLMSTD